jgi:hypothetical protein
MTSMAIDSTGKIVLPSLDKWYLVFFSFLRPHLFDWMTLTALMVFYCNCFVRRFSLSLSQWNCQFTFGCQLFKTFPNGRHDTISFPFPASTTIPLEKHVGTIHRILPFLLCHFTNKTLLFCIPTHRLVWTEYASKFKPLHNYPIAESSKSFNFTKVWWQPTAKVSLAARPTS